MGWRWYAEGRGAPGAADRVRTLSGSARRTAPQARGGSDNGLNKLLAQLLAAKLNIKVGASDAAVASTIAAADAFLATNNNWGALSKTQRAQVLAWKDTLDKFNMGNIGPGKCTQ